MVPKAPWSGRPHTVTFDCWGTLLYEPSPSELAPVRARVLADYTGVSEQQAGLALHAAWQEHQVLWHRRVAFTGAHMVRHALEQLGSKLEPSRELQLIDVLETLSVERPIQAVEGACELLMTLARLGVRRALICDTGFSPGRVVRQLLDRVGLLEHLEVTVFSDEIGVPKPEPRAFQAALRGLGVTASGAIHVGDLRRSDIAGAKRAAMGSVRIRARYDDGATPKERGAGVIDCMLAGCVPACERPEADVVVDSFQQLAELLETR